VTWSNVAIGSGNDRHGFVGLNQLGDSEIGDSGLHLSVQKNVTGFEITVDDDGVAVVVKVGDSLSNAEGDLVPGEPIGGEIITFVFGMQQIIQVSIGHVLVKQHCALLVAAAP